MEKKNFTFGLIPRLILAIVLGVLVGTYLPEVCTKVAVTFSANFGKLLGFIIPLMILAFVTKGISDLSEGAGKLLGLAVVLSYISTLVAGSLSYIMASNIFQNFISPEMVDKITSSSENTVEAYFTIPLEPAIDVTGALVLAFMLGLCVSILRQKGSGQGFYTIINEFNEMIHMVLSKAIIPVLPFFIFGNFANMAYSGTVFAILGIFAKIFACIIILHILYLTGLFLISGGISGRNPFSSLKNALPAYFTAIGTQSSAATIPVNVECNRKMGVSKQIRDFVIPLCATVHLPGSMITLTACIYTLLEMYGMPHDFSLILKFIAILGIAMVAAPGAPGGAVMSALPFLPFIGIATESPMAAILVSLYITQDSFGTAANVVGDNAISMMVEKLYYKHILKRPLPKEEI